MISISVSSFLQANLTKFTREPSSGEYGSFPEIISSSNNPKLYTLPAGSTSDSLSNRLSPSSKEAFGVDDATDFHTLTSTIWQKKKKQTKEEMSHKAYVFLHSDGLTSVGNWSYLSGIIFWQQDGSRKQFRVGYRWIELVHMLQTVRHSHYNPHPDLPIYVLEFFHCNIYSYIMLKPISWCALINDQIITMKMLV